MLKIGKECNRHSGSKDGIIVEEKKRGFFALEGTCVK